MAERSDTLTSRHFALSEALSDEVNTTPLLKDLYQCITPRYAADWEVIGTLLGLPSGELKAIEAGYPTNVKWCCNQMLKKWLEVDPTASWKKLFTAIDSPAVSSSQNDDKATSSKFNFDKLTVADKGADAVSILSETVSQCNVRERLNSVEETWPPDQPKNFTPLVLIHHQGQHTMKQATAVAQLIQTNELDDITLATSNLVMIQECYLKLEKYEPLQEIFDSSSVTKELTEILAPLEQSKDPQFILIEGAPGIGKSMLFKEIAYRWGKKQLLKTFKLLLLVHLRDPSIQQATSVKDLLQMFCKKGDTRSTEIATTSSDYLVQNDGKDLVFLLDGIDEYPETLQKDSLIADLLNRKVLSHCGLVVSSRPHATVHLREQATIRVDILGFTKLEQNQFIQQALKERPQSIKELTQYLEDHFTISSLCTVPFNMVVLLFLYKQGILLPNNSTELYNHFICLTICRHLAKHGHPLENKITDLTNLPNPYNKIIQQLAKLSLEALNNDKLVFTLDEIKAACPDIPAIPGSINGFGLLQAVQHFGLTGKTMTFNFLHFSIQEFLAAYHITCLSPSDEFKVLKSKFWSDTHSNMFIFYITITKGQRPSFKQFLKPSIGQRIKRFLRGTEVGISDQFLDTDLKSLHLFRCFFEAGNLEMCRIIENTKTLGANFINFCNSRLSLGDLECVTLFLTCSSHKSWKKLCLRGCFIQDQGVHILHHGLKSCQHVTIKTLSLSFNGLTESSSSAISDIIIKCSVCMLWIKGNEIIGRDERLYRIISDPTSMLEELYMSFTKLSPTGAIKLFTALSNGIKLRVLWINGNDITDEACDAIEMALKKNTSLVKLWMSHNPISGECARLIVQSLQHNSSLQQLVLPYYHDCVKERIRLSAEEVNRQRESYACQQKLEVILL